MPVFPLVELNRHHIYNTLEHSVTILLAGCSLLQMLFFHVDYINIGSIHLKYRRKVIIFIIKVVV